MPSCSQTELTTYLATCTKKMDKILGAKTMFLHRPNMIGSGTNRIPVHTSGRLGEDGSWLVVPKDSDPANIEAMYASFGIQQLTGCCGVCVSTAAQVSPTYRHRGLGTYLNEVRQGMAKRLGYAVMLCTDVETNVYERKILKKTGWRDIYRFANPRTRNIVHISIRDLADVSAKDCPTIEAAVAMAERVLRAEAAEAVTR